MYIIKRRLMKDIICMCEYKVELTCNFVIFILLRLKSLKWFLECGFYGDLSHVLALNQLFNRKKRTICADKTCSDIDQVVFVGCPVRCLIQLDEERRANLWHTRVAFSLRVN